MKVRSLARKGWIPVQHGAWAITFMPLLVGMVHGGFIPIHLLLSASWMSAFLCFNAFGLLIKARKKSRYWPATITYGALAFVGAAFLLIKHPQLWFWGLPLAVFFLWTVIEILRGAAKSLGARISAIFSSCLMTPISFSLGSHPDDWTNMWVGTAIVTAFFVGIVPYIRTLMRERGNRAWLVGSLAYHTVALAAAIFTTFLGVTPGQIPILAAVLLGRAWLFPRVLARNSQKSSLKFIQFSEVAFCILVLLAVLI